MRLSIADLGDAGALTSPGFSSSLPSAAKLGASWTKGASEYFDVAKPAASFLGDGLWRNQLQVFQTAQAIAATSVGVLTQDLDGLGEVLSATMREKTLADWSRAVAGTVTNLVIDQVLGAMGSVPFFGPIVKTIVGLLNLLVQRLTAEAPKPPLVTYSKSRDEEEAALAKVVLQSADWTRLFMPPGSGGWVSANLEGGWGYESDVIEASQLGCWPGGWGGSRRLQVQSFKIGPQCGGGFGVSAKKLEKCLDDYFRYTLVPSGKVASHVMDTFGALPSLDAFGRATWAALSGRRSAAMFAVDTRKLSAWGDYYDGLRDRAAYDVSSGLLVAETSKQWLGGRSALWRTYAHGYRFDAVASDVKHVKGMGVPIESVIAAYASDLRKRQERSLDTLLCAYASEGQGAFRSSKLNAKLHANRVALLKSPARRDVVLGDIVDPSYRAAMATAQLQASNTMLAPGFDRGGDWSLDGVPGAPRPPTRSGGRAKRASSGGGLAIAAAAILLARVK